MTLVNSEADSSAPHVGELRLRRFRAGEFSGEAHEEVARHTAECAACRAKLRLLQEEQRQFERDIPFERFAGGVERACRVPRPSPKRRWVMGGTFGLVAAAAVVVLLVRPSGSVGGWGGHAVGDHAGSNRIKGGGLSAVVRIASASGGAQRSLPPAGSTTLQPGERIRLGYSTAVPGYLAAVSVDDAGEVSALYPEGGGSLPVGPTQQVAFLPDSLELTGSGRERVFLLLAARPLDGAAVKKSVRDAHARAKGDLGALALPSFAGRTDVQPFSWLFLKP
jgi:anti-sigma factor RsiW